VPAVRPYKTLRMVLTVCGRCFSDDPDQPIDYERDVLQGSLVEMDGGIYLRRVCRRGHGEVMSLYEEDAARWADLQQWRVPTRELVADQPGDARPIPTGYLDGLGELQDQHTCVLLVDLDEACNLSCPSCFAGSGPARDRHATGRGVLATVDAAVQREGGRADLVMLSGGEPTIHPDFEAIVEGILDRPVTRVVVNTNGLRLARDDKLLDFFAGHRDRMEVYLSFDGLREDTYRLLRGANLLALKHETLGRLTGAHVFTTLACMVAAGVNDDEVGAVLDLALATRYVGGVAYQPLFGPTVPDPMRRATTTGMIQRLADQSGNVRADDFIGLPCSHPDCSSLTYLLRTDHGEWRSLPSLVGLDQLRQHLGLMGNRIIPDDELWTALSSLLSETMLVGRPELVEHLATLADVCNLGMSGFVRSVGKAVLGPERMVELAALRVKRVAVKSFMDAWTLNVERLKQCCIHVGSVDPGAPPIRIPFCARNTFGALRARSVAGMVGRERLADDLRHAPGDAVSVG
jgi:uncharacterized radical SAM superfamily Fe-S cluster-containing enzyme